MDESKNNFTTIQIKVSTRDKLKGIGKKEETYDTLILRLIESIEKQVNL
jgi:hypothetical protein